MKKKPKTLWASRSKNADLIYLNNSKPGEFYGAFIGRKIVTSFYAKDFNLFASKPIKPGECRRVRLVVE